MLNKVFRVVRICSNLFIFLKKIQSLETLIYTKMSEYINLLVESFPLRYNLYNKIFINRN